MGLAAPYPASLRAMACTAARDFQTASERMPALPAPKLPDEDVAPRQRVEAYVLVGTNRCESAVRVIANDLKGLAVGTFDFEVVPSEDDWARADL